MGLFVGWPVGQLVGCSVDGFSRERIIRTNGVFRARRSSAERVGTALEEEGKHERGDGLRQRNGVADDLQRAVGNHAQPVERAA